MTQPPQQPRRMFKSSSKVITFDVTVIRPQWHHPVFETFIPGQPSLSRKELEGVAYHFYLRFLPLFRNQPEGSIQPGAVIEFSRRMRQKLGLAFLFEHKIRLNEVYFGSDPRLLPYTLFHEMTHLWLYSCGFDPGHTRRFYRKMEAFEATGLPVDPSVHIHSRIAPEAQFVYICPNCSNRWYMREPLRHKIYCGHCYDREGVEYFARPTQAAASLKDAPTVVPK